MDTQKKKKLSQSSPVFSVPFLRPRSNYKTICTPGNVFVHEGVEAVVEVAAGQSQAQQRLQEVRPAQLRGESDVSRLAVKSDD